MKILKIFGIVVGVHVFALILIFANPGCSSSKKSRPSPKDTAIATEPIPMITVPNNGTANKTSESPVARASLDGDYAGSPVVAAPISLGGSSSNEVRFSPTRPNTPVASTLQAQPVADVVPASVYDVVKGDSLWSVSKAHQLSLSELAAANNISVSATLRLGQKLIIPAKTATTAAEPVTARVEAPAGKPAAESVTHTVKPGETLGAIARKYQVTVGEIATANNITDPGKIRPGRELIIPGWKTPSSHSATKAATGGNVAPASETKVTAPSPAAPIFKLPSADQDLDAGLKKAGDAPVIMVEEADTHQPL